MYKFIFDSDALIKSAKSDILEKFCQHYNCFISTEVKNECVDEGKRRLYKDALAIEEFINQGLITVKEVKKARKIREDLGKGEVSAVNLYFQEKNTIIVTDDSAFTKYIEENKIKFCVPADLILLMRISNKIDGIAALRYLEKIKEFIKEEVYFGIKKDIMETKK